MTTLTTHHNYWLHTQDKNHHESQLNNRFLYLTGSNFGLETIGKRARENAVETEKGVSERPYRSVGYNQDRDGR